MRLKATVEMPLIGDRINHSKLRAGVVIKIEEDGDDQKVTVCFDSGEEKMFLASYGFLEKTGEKQDLSETEAPRPSFEILHDQERLTHSIDEFNQKVNDIIGSTE